MRRTREHIGKKGRDRSQRRRGFDDGEYSAPPSYDNRSRQPFRSAPREEAAPSGPAIDAIVKWFNAEKGFGFVVCEDGEKDVFVHVSIVERAGLPGLDEGQRVAMKVVKTPKGREAIALKVID